MIIIVLWVLVLVLAVAANCAVAELRRSFELAMIIALTALVALSALGKQWSTCALAVFLALGLGLFWWYGCAREKRPGRLPAGGGVRSEGVRHIMSTAEHAFTDLVSGMECTLVIPPDGRLVPLLPDQAKIGVRHPHCELLADVVVNYDAFFCSACQFNGRISGAWCVDMIEAAKFPS